MNAEATIREEADDAVGSEDEEDIQMYSSEDEELAEMDSSFDEDAREKQRADAGAAPVQSRSEGKRAERPRAREVRRREKRVERAVEKVFRVKFHSVSKSLAIVDASRAEKLARAQFRELMGRVGLQLSEEDVDSVWRGFGDVDEVPFSNIVRRFVMPEEFSRLRKVSDKVNR